MTDLVACAILCGMSDLAPELARLSPRQRLDLVEALWESLDDKDAQVTDAQRAELDRGSLVSIKTRNRAFRGTTLEPIFGNGAERAVGRLQPRCPG